MELEFVLNIIKCKSIYQVLKRKETNLIYDLIAVEFNKVLGKLAGEKSLRTELV